MTQKIVKVIRAYETEIVRILWTRADGSTYEQDVTLSKEDKDEGNKET